METFDVKIESSWKPKGFEIKKVTANNISDAEIEAKILFGKKAKVLKEKFNQIDEFIKEN